MPRTSSGFQGLYIEEVKMMLLKRNIVSFIIAWGIIVFSVANIGATIVNTAWVSYYGGSESDTCTLTTPSFYSIKGKVKDSNGKGISYVNVDLSGDKLATYLTKENGYYEFTDLPLGNYTVTPGSAYWEEGFEPLSRNYAPLNQDYEDQNFEPNPSSKSKIIPIKNLFNPAKGEYTAIKYDLKDRCQVVIKLYDLLGEPIITLVDEEKDAGSYSIDWFGKNEEGSTVASGTYLLYFKAGDYKKIEKIIIIK